MKPNILIITADQLRRDGLGCYGDPITQTPNFDRLAREGVRFNNCVSTHPVCSPWRATLQTGQYAWKHGVMENNTRIDTTLPSLADAFNDAGYHTAFYGKAHWWDSGKPGYYDEAPRLRYQEWWGFNRGHYHWDAPDFDENGKETHRYAGQYEPEVQTDRAVDLIKRDHDKPWMLCLNWGPPHNASMDTEYNDPQNRKLMKRINQSRKWDLSDDIMDHQAPDDPKPVTQFPQHLSGRLCPEGYLGLYPEQNFEARPDVPAEQLDLNRAMRREVSAMTTSLDDQLGRILVSLEQSGQLDNTIIVFTSDHGDHLGAFGQGRGKASWLQSAWRTPLLIRGPECIKQNINEALVSGVDLMPTICGLAGIAQPEGLAGQDCSDLCRGKANSEQDSVVIGLKNWRSLVTNKWCYTAKKINDSWEPTELIDLENDVWDLHSCLEKNSEISQKLHKNLLEKLHESQDPFTSQI